jgi:hypothetical protein
MPSYGRDHQSCLSPAAASSGPPGARRTAVDAGLTWVEQSGHRTHRHIDPPPDMMMHCGR